MQRSRSHNRDTDVPGFVAQVHAEFTKFRTVRGWVATLVAAIVVFVLLAFLSAWASRSTGPTVATGPSGEPVSDSYTFVHQPLAGDGSITVRVSALSGAHRSTSPRSGRAQLQPGLAPWAKAGLIIEPDTSQGTSYAAVMVTGSHGVRMQYDYTHDRRGLSGLVGLSSSRWLRLTRAGDLITGYDSLDGAHWSEIGTARLTGLPHTVQAGLFVTSPLHFAAGADAGTPTAATATFDHLQAQGELLHQSWTGDAIAGAYPGLPSASFWQQRSASAFTIAGSGDIAPLAGGIDPHWSGASVVNGTIAAMLVVIVLAALFVTSEYRRSLIRTTLTASPRRGRVLAAKAVVAGALAFVSGAIATALAEVITRHVFAANGNYLFPQSAPATARIILGTGLFLALAAALVAALASILRRSLATVVAGFAFVMLPGILATSLSAGAASWLMRFTPTAAFAIQAALPRLAQVDSAYTIRNGYFPISGWAGLAVLAGYTAIAFAAATWLLHRRDA